MENEKLGQEAAFPDPARCAEQSISNQSPWANPSGMSKRFYAACAAMQGILSNTDLMTKVHEVSNSKNEDPKLVVIRNAYEFADELLKQENE